MQYFGKETSICRLTYYCGAGLGDTCMHAWGVCDCCWYLPISGIMRNLSALHVSKM
jgi:hypothetical protein